MNERKVRREQASKQARAQDARGYGELRLTEVSTEEQGVQGAERECLEELKQGNLEIKRNILRAL